MQHPSKTITTGLKNLSENTCALKKEIINQLSLLYCWKGSNPHLQPVLFASHLDVVPVDKATLTAWHAILLKERSSKVLPGTRRSDMKNHTVALFEARERWLIPVPAQRDIILPSARTKRFQGKRVQRASRPFDEKRNSSGCCFGRRRHDQPWFDPGVGDTPGFGGNWRKKKM